MGRNGGSIVCRTTHTNGHDLGSSHTHTSHTLHFPSQPTIQPRYYLEDYDHKTIAECAELCLNDPGCKSFDAGDKDQFQAGDCFMSFDNRFSIKEGDFRRVVQLDYYEKKDVELVLDLAYTKVRATTQEQIS